MYCVVSLATSFRPMTQKNILSVAIMSPISLIRFLYLLPLHSSLKGTSFPTYLFLYLSSSLPHTFTHSLSFALHQSAPHSFSLSLSLPLCFSLCVRLRRLQELSCRKCPALKQLPAARTLQCIYILMTCIT